MSASAGPLYEARQAPRPSDLTAAGFAIWRTTSWAVTLETRSGTGAGRGTQPASTAAEANTMSRSTRGVSSGVIG